ncbi:MAG: ABC transporter ATP-binding protein [Ardenticatenales bacterium]|nr:ABC transporter ATP-binding protein [Ardenticatenales bacterium]
MIQVEELSKRYGTTVALDRVTVAIPEGAIWGILGHNGSGKSTFLKCLLGFLLPDSGRVVLEGITQREMGYLAEHVFFPKHEHVADYLHTAGQISGISGSTLRTRVPYLLEQVRLWQARAWQIRDCSKGMRQQLGIAQAIVHDPRLVILDEPMEGLDPTWQHRIRAMIRGWRAVGKTVLMSTHRLSDITELCSHVSIFRSGRVVTAGKLDEVLVPQPRVTIVVTLLNTTLLEDLTSLHPQIQVEQNTITLAAEAVPLKETVLYRLLDGGAEIIQLTHERRSLEELYLEAMSA